MRILIHQGEGAAGIHRHYADLARQRTDLDQLVSTSTMPAPHTTGTAPGDTRKLRGIPAIGRGVPGAINGTRP